MTIREYVAQFDHEIVGKLKRVSTKDATLYDKRYRTYVDEVGNVYDINVKTGDICVSTEDGCF